jgi:hypothetical protein
VCESSRLAHENGAFTVQEQIVKLNICSLYGCDYSCSDIYITFMLPVLKTRTSTVERLTIHILGIVLLLFLT